ncbi:MAG: CusA/CzcA family heavy metal efflux RND transporter [Nitrospirales bacterium]|nr:efflux RND transporter permease subunit [Nitrospira sp.]MDR4502510.1 CusA/CzcA family heavy metal efflux RND transporter [Nitrospirales bacterium]
MERLLTLSLQYRFFTLVTLVLVTISGLWSLHALTIDAVPDLTPVQVQILTRSPALGPVEVEQFITFPIETSLSGLPGLQEIRSVSRYGLSAVTAIFHETFDQYFVRQLVSERLALATQEIPPVYGRPMMGPPTTGLGEVYQFTLRSERQSPMALRTLLEWDIARRLQTVPGVVEVNIWGGETKQFQVVVNPGKLLSFNLTLKQIFETLEQNNALVGGGYIEHEREHYLIKGEAMASSIAELEHIVIDHGPGGVPIFIKDIGEVRENSSLRIGAASRMGEGETVIGMVQMLAGANAQQVVSQVKERVQEIQSTLPPEVIIEPYYDRTLFVDQVIQTVRNNLIEGGLLVIAILFLFLGDLRAGMIVATAIPLSMLIAFTGMYQAGISGNLMSLGAIDFGLLVDGSVVMIDNILRKLGATGKGSKDQKRAVIQEAAQEVLRPIVYAVTIIIVVYVPILSLIGLEGKLFRPMAITVIFALAGSLLFAVAVVPVLSYWFAQGTSNHEETWLIRQARRIYQPCLRFSLSRPAWIVIPAIGLFLLSLLAGSRLGIEFMPQLEEGDMAIQIWRLPSISLSESVETALAVERVVRQFPEVTQVVTRTGSPEVATDVMGIELSDVFVVLKPIDDWTTASTKDELITIMRTAILDAVPGIGLGFTQPIEMRFNELIGGTRSDLAIKIFGEDMKVLRQQGERIAQTLGQVAGAKDIQVEQVTGIPRIRAIVDREQLGRYGLNAKDVLTVIEAARVGRTVGTIFEGQRRFALIVRLSDEASSSPSALGNILIPTNHGELVPLSRVAHIKVDEGLAQISRENVQRRLVVEANIRGRDLGSFVTEAQRAIQDSITLPTGYYLEWGGQYTHLQAATKRLSIILPITLLLILAILSVIFGTLPPALLIFLNVPLALSGGLLALWLRELPLSISAMIGCIALFGIAVLNGVVLVSRIRRLESRGLPTSEAVAQGSMDRLRPVLMTALVASLGFLPMAIATSMGAEVQRPLATVVIGGLITSTALTLLVIPSLYRFIGRSRQAMVASHGMSMAPSEASMFDSIEKES